jgi:transposase
MKLVEQHMIKEHEAYQALPRKVSDQVLIQLRNAWVGFFEAMEEWREEPSRFNGRPKLPGYKHKTQGRNLLVYEKGAIWKRELDQGVIAVSELGALVQTAQSRETVSEVRILPKVDHYMIEVVYQQQAKPARVDPALFVEASLRVSVLEALSSNEPGFIPRLVNGKPIKSRNQYYNQQRARRQSRLANQNFVQIPHARFIELLTYKAEMVGIQVILTEESYTSRASFLDRDPVPACDPARAEEPRFSGNSFGRWYSASGKRIMHSDVNGSYSIGRKVVSTAFDGPGIAAPAVRPRRLAV